MLSENCRDRAALCRDGIHTHHGVGIVCFLMLPYRNYLDSFGLLHVSGKLALSKNILYRFGEYVYVFGVKSFRSFELQSHGMSPIALLYNDIIHQYLSPGASLSREYHVPNTHRELLRKSNPDPFDGEQLPTFRAVQGCTSLVRDKCGMRISARWTQ